MASIKNFFKQGLGLGLGLQVSFIVFMIIGFLFFLPGYILFKGQEEAGKKGSSTQLVGIVLMGIGVIIMGGLGFSTLMGSIDSYT